jgi:site-specific DNA-methyltransferase (adenine-specific)
MAPQIYNGDCLKILPDLASESIELILVDLPYGATDAPWDCPIDLNSLWGNWVRILKPRGTVALFGVEPFSTGLRTSMLKYFKYDWVWAKTKATGFLTARKRPMAAHEMISIFNPRGAGNYYPQRTQRAPGQRKRTAWAGSTKGSVLYGIAGAPPYLDDGFRHPLSVQTFKKDPGRWHPTQKPVALLDLLIRSYTLPGDTVLDCCMGSGSTGVASLLASRNFIGIEKEVKYFNIAKDRLAP